MRGSTGLFAAALLVGGAAVPVADAQDNPPAAAPANPPAAAPASPAPSTPSSLVLYFDSGSSAIRPQDVALLDQASRLYRAGNPLVMIVTGSADKTGSPAVNLRLSESRANAVLQGLVARGIPIERFQVMAKGETDLIVPTAANVAEERNRRVEITWR